MGGIGDYKSFLDSSLAGVNRNLVKLLQETEKSLCDEKKTSARLKDEVDGLKLRLHAMDDDRLAVEGKEKLLLGMLEEEEEQKLKFERELKELRIKVTTIEAERQGHAETSRALVASRAEERRLRTLLAACESDREDRAHWEAEREGLLQQIAAERKALEDREKRMREELRHEGKASLQALQSMRQRIGELRRDRRALEEKERELDIERDLRVHLESEMEAMHRKFLDFEHECRALRESITLGTAGPNEVALRGRVVQLEDVIRAMEARLVLAEQERDALRAQLERERVRVKADSEGKGGGGGALGVTDQELAEVRRERCEMEASYEVLRAGLKMRMAQLEEERAARAEEVGRKMEQYHQRECSSEGTTAPESGMRKKGGLSPPSAAMFVFGGNSKERTKTSSTSSSFESVGTRSSLESNGSRRSAGSTRGGMTLPPSDPADQKLKHTFIAPSPPLPVVGPPRDWRSVTRRQSSSDEKTPVLTEEDVEDLDSSDSSSDASSAVWDSDVEADLEVEFENAKARALHCIKSGTAPGSLVSPVK